MLFGRKNLTNLETEPSGGSLLLGRELGVTAQSAIAAEWADIPGRTVDLTKIKVLLGTYTKHKRIRDINRTLINTMHKIYIWIYSEHPPPLGPSSSASPPPPRASPRVEVDSLIALQF